MLLYAIEFYFSRDEIRSLSGAATSVKMIRQDADKLKLARGMGGFVDRARNLAFLKGTCASFMQAIEDDLKDRDDIELVFAG